MEMVHGSEMESVFKNDYDVNLVRVREVTPEILIKMATTNLTISFGVTMRKKFPDVQNNNKLM